jgi:hypothetical protein
MKQALTSSNGSHLTSRYRKISFIPLVFIFLCHTILLCADDQGVKAVRRDSQASGIAIAKERKRIALVIGNNEYVDARLENPPHDAEDVTHVLQELGFTVHTRINVNQREMEEAVDEFSREIQDGNISLFYFSGHGVQARGENFLIPVGSSIRSESDVRFKAVNVGYILSKMEESRNRTNILVLDACRNNPFKGFRSLNRGLNAVEAPRGTFIAYATAPGTVAEDGSDRNSPYTKHLIQALKVKDITIYDVFGQVLLAVEKETAGKQIPWISSSVPNFIINPSGTATSTPAPGIPSGTVGKPHQPVATLLLTTSPAGARVHIGARDVGRSGENGLLIVKDAEVGTSLDIRVEKEGFKGTSVTLIIPSSYDGQAYTYGEIRLQASLEDRSGAFRRVFPDFGTHEFDLAQDDLYPDWKRSVSPAGTWAEFLAVYKKFVQWWSDRGSPAEPGMEQWKRFLAASDLASGAVGPRIREHPPELLARLSREYHDHYVASEKDEMMAFYEFPLKYYERGYQDRSFVDSEWQQYFAKWTAREAEVKSIEHSGGSMASGDVTIRLTYSYRWTNLRGQEATGTASSLITWRKIDDEWKIVELNEKRETDAKVQGKPEHTPVSWRRAVVTDPDGFACLREGKGTNFECFAQVTDGEEVSVQRSDDAWLRVKTSNGQEGFMHFSRLKIIPESPAERPPPRQAGKTSGEFPKRFPESLPETRWYVVAGSHLHLEDAMKHARKLNATSQGFRAQIYEPQEDNPHYAVVIGEDLTLEAARELKQKAIAAGLPKDTYLKPVR